MADANDPQELPEALPAGGPTQPRKRRCAACSSEDLVKMGRLHEPIAFVPPEAESKWFGLAPQIRPNLWACLDCGFVGWFLKREELQRLRDQHE